MPTVDIYNTDKKKVGTVDLDDAVFGAEVKEHLFYTAVRYQMAKRRQGTHKTKSRSEVRGGGRKPFRQKGTGRARQGTIRAVHMRGGGVVFGPTVRDHAHKMPKKVRLDLAGCDKDRGAGCEPGMVFDVVDTEGLLDPIRMIGFVTFHVAKCGRQIVPRIVGIEHQKHLGPNRLARGGNPLLLLVGREPPDLHHPFTVFHQTCPG